MHSKTRADARVRRVIGAPGTPSCAQPVGRPPVPVQAGPPLEAYGLWQYKPYILEERIVGGNTFLKTFEEGLWTGTFAGTSTEDGKVVIHRNGDWSFNAIVSFEGEVEGKG